jgi:hypothetical protein
MTEKLPIVFKSEPALWDMLAQVNPDGTSARPFDFRRWDFSDERIYRLAWGYYTRDIYRTGLEQATPKLHQAMRHGESWHPDEKEVSFVNKATGELLTFEYLGVEFADWAPGWGFLILGKRLRPPVEET